jgi:putative transposase
VEPSNKRNPTFAVGRRQAEALKISLRSVRAFRLAYREALDKWRTGVRDVVFPHGTWLMHQLHRARVDAGPDALAHAS